MKIRWFYILGIVLSLACVPRSLEVAYGEGLARNVKIEGVEGFCSGVILRTGKVLTAAHCASIKLTVDDKPAKMLKIDPEADLMLLAVQTKPLPDIRFGDARVTNVVLSVSNFGDFTNLVRVGRITKTEKDIVFHDLMLGPGSSGSGLYNEYGQLIGLHHRSMDMGSPIGPICIGGQAVPVRKVLKFLDNVL